ncbi:hypothetical protein ACKWTF_002460 [Chironomus riparius]
MSKEQVHRNRKNRNGIQIGCFRFCTSSCCETLLINFGMRELSVTAFHSFLTTVSACLSTTFILCLCYTLSSRSYCLIRQSLFEIIFNGLACFSFGSAALYMGFISKLPSYRNILLFTINNTNPALTSIYYVGTLLAVVYFADTVVAYKHYRDFKD